MANLTVELIVPWWVKPYLTLLIWYHTITRTEPDEAKITERIIKSIKIK